MGVHKVSPLLWSKEAKNPLQKGGVYGFDVMTLMYALLANTAVYRALTRRPTASVKREVAAWLDDWWRVHQFGPLQISLAFTFDGHSPGLTARRRAQRARDVLRWEQTARAATTWTEHDKMCQKLARVDGHLVRAFIDWVRSRVPAGKYCFLGAPFEADAQLSYLGE